MTPVDEEIIAGFEDQKAESKQRRARNRARGVQQLREASIPFSTHNGGAHIVIRVARAGSEPNLIIDYWPGTGLWRKRKTGLRGSGTADGRGIQSLIQLLKQTSIKA